MRDKICAKWKDQIKVGKNPIEFCTNNIEEIVVDDVDDSKKGKMNEDGNGCR